MQELLLLQALGSSMDVLYPSDVRARLERTSTSTRVSFCASSRLAAASRLRTVTLLSFEGPPALLVQISKLAVFCERFSSCAR